MSFVHNVRVGFFGTPDEKHPARELGPDECMGWMRRYNDFAPEDLHVLVEPVPRGTLSRGMVLGYVEGHPITLKNGLLTCPVLTTHYVGGSIAFVAFLHKAIDCSIYSDDDGRFLTLDEFVPRESFKETFRRVMLSISPDSEELKAVFNSADR